MQNVVQLLNSIFTLQTDDKQANEEENVFKYSESSLWIEINTFQEVNILKKSVQKKVFKHWKWYEIFRLKYVSKNIPNDKIIDIEDVTIRTSHVRSWVNFFEDHLYQKPIQIQTHQQLWSSGTIVVKQVLRDLKKPIDKKNNPTNRIRSIRLLSPYQTVSHIM